MDRIALNKTHLQLTAIAAMTLDHIAWALSPGYSAELWAVLFHCAGRIAAPIMWYFIAEGYDRTGDIKKYGARLLAFALISHFAYNFFTGNSFIPFTDSYFEQTSVIWPLLGGLAGICVVENEAYRKWQKAAIIALICLLTFCSDWSCVPVLAIVWIHINKGNFKLQAAGMQALGLVSGIFMFLFMDKLYGCLQLLICLSFPLLFCYNGRRGAQPFGKYFFYIYYPAHLIVLGIIKYATNIQAYF